MTDVATARAELERHFRRSGLPHLTDDYDPREDTLTRLRPALLVLFVVALGLAVRPSWPWWGQALGALAGLGIAGTALAMLNLARGLPALRRPDRVGFTEAAVFVLAPAVAEVALGDPGWRAVWLAAGSVAVAVVLYALVSMGVVPMVVHLGRAAAEGVADTAAVALRAMPPVLAVLLFLFLASEVWQAFGLLEGWRFGSVLTVFALMGTAFTVVALRRETRDLVSPPLGEETRRRALAGPAAPLVAAGVRPVAPPMERLARLNVLVALVVAVGARVIAVGVATGLFFMLFGVLVVDEALTASWIGQSPHVLLEVSPAGREVVVTEELVRVATLLGGFSALYFLVVALTETARREDVLEDELERLACVMAAWAYYRGTSAAPAADPAATPPESR